MNAEDLLANEDASGIVVEEHWARKGDVDLYLIRKVVPAARVRGPKRT